MTHYHLSNKTYRHFSDLVNAYFQEKGGWPIKPKRETLEADGWHLYY